MNNVLKMGFTLAFVCAIAAGSLQIVYSITKPVIDENIRIAAIKKRQEVLSEAVSFGEKKIKPTKKISSDRIWIGLDKNGKRVGTVLEVSPRGYGGLIRTTIGILPDGKISAVAINKLDQQETPGLGVKITRPDFKNQFKGKAGKQLKLKKDGGEIDGITSATISSRAVASGIKAGWDWYSSNQESLKAK